MTEKTECWIPAGYVAPLLVCAGATGLSLEEIVEIVLKFYLNRSENNA